jgi:hypothetical protein
MPRSKPPPGAKRKIIEFDAETGQALHSLALDRMNTVQELVEDAVTDLLKKHTPRHSERSARGECSGRGRTT